MIESKKISYNQAVAHITERFHKAYQANVFVCEVCYKTIEPVIKAWGDEVFIESDSSSISGGRGNKVIKTKSM